MRIGARIEFWESTTDGKPGGKLQMTAVVEDGFDALAVPAVGELLSVISLAGLKDGHLLRGEAGPFLRVRNVEHYPVLAADPALRDGSDTWRIPSVSVTFRLGGLSGRSLEQLQAVLSGRGWEASIHTD